MRDAGDIQGASSMRVRIALISWILVTLTAASAFSGESTQPATGNGQTIESILAKADGPQSEDLWHLGTEMASLPADQAKAMEKAIDNASPAGKIVLGQGLMKHGFQRPAALSLTAMIRSEDAPLARKVDAAALLGAQGGDYAAYHIRDCLRDGKLPERLRVELAKSLWKLTHGQTAFEELQQVARDGTSPSARAEAVLALGRFGRFETVADDLKKLSERPGRVGEEAQTILALKTRIEKEVQSLDKETPPFPARLISEISLRTRAFVGSDKLKQAVTDELEELARTAGPIGDEARLLKSLAAKIRSRTDDEDFPAELISEVVEKVHDRYAPDETDQEETQQLKSRTLANEAAAALLTSIDPFNDYLDEESLRDMEEQLHSSYGGIGAWVGMRNGRFTILTPMFSKPAFRAGLRSMDVVEKIDDVEIKDMKLNRIIKMLKGPPGTDVRVTIWRKGWKDTRPFTITRDIIDIPSVITQRLPGNIGYIKLTAFNDGNPKANPPIKGTADLLRDALIECNKDNVKGLILDLTNNPGGLLQAAVEVAQNFLEPGKLIVYSQGKPGVYPRRNYHTRNREPVYDGELIVMVNSGSASASEIVAGALKDHKRATLVGEKTFGKGSVQQLIPLATTRGMTRMKLTIAKYYLPNDECIHKKGIEPNVTVEEPDPEWSEVDARLKLRDNRDIEKWLDQHFAQNEKAFREALEFDNFDPSRYPTFDELITSLQQKYTTLTLTPEAVRKELRFALRNYLRNNKGEELPVDLEENTVLQHAILELGKRIDGGLPDLPIYQALKKRVEEKAREIAAAAREDGMQIPGGETD